ncbi:3-carboxy-cis,cis-muconate cycloisomerase, partial [Streptomyces sp. NPDC052127]
MTTAHDDAGLLAPGWTGSPAAAATADGAYLRALLDAGPAPAPPGRGSARPPRR